MVVSFPDPQAKKEDSESLGVGGTQPKISGGPIMALHIRMVHIAITVWCLYDIPFLLSILLFLCRCRVIAWNIESMHGASEGFFQHVCICHLLTVCVIHSLRVFTAVHVMWHYLDYDMYVHYCKDIYIFAAKLQVCFIIQCACVHNITIMYIYIYICCPQDVWSAAHLHKQGILRVS